MDVCIDSRKIKKGQIFIPVKGPHFDGRDFIQDALDKGARILDVDLSDYAKKYRKKLNCHVIGITGSAGKTTVKDMLYYVLSQKYRVVRTEENENNEIGVPLTLLRADSDTEILIVEMGIRQPGDMSVLTKLVRPSHVVITGIGLTHVELLKTQKRVAQEKGKIFAAPLQWEETPRSAFLNFTTPYYDLLKKQAESKGFQIYPFKGERKVDLNVNLCYLIGQHFSLTHEEISAGLQAFQPSSHRLQTHQIAGITIIDDSYNANPDGVQYALEYLKGVPGRKIAVLGDMLELGEMSAQCHQDLIDVAIDAQVDVLYTFGKDVKVMKSDTLPPVHFSEKSALISALEDELKDGDVVLVKGSRGMKMEEIVSHFMKRGSQS